MFSGIVEKTSRIIKTQKRNGNLVLEMALPRGWQVKPGESVNIDGVCSTVVAANKTSFTVNYMPETLKRTTFARAQVGDVVNLERSLRLQDRLGGHLVAGHADSVAEVTRYRPAPGRGSTTVVFRLPAKFMRYLVYKGSVAVNGVSLTVVETTRDTFSVSLIPYTLQNTNLGSLEISDKVNIEIDILAKYVEKLLKEQK